MSKQIENSKDTSINEDRRQLLKGITTAAVASAVVSGAAQATSTEVVDIEPENKKTTGYRETQHIRDYYDTL